MFRCPSDPDRAFSPRQGRCSIPDRSPRPSPAMCSRCRERQRGTYGRSALRVSHTRSVRFRPAYPHEFAYPGRGGSLSHILYAHSAVIPCSTPRCAWPCTARSAPASRPEALRCGSLCAQLSPVPDTLAGEPWATPRAVSPVEDGAGTSAKELEHWGSALGHHLAAHGSTGPYGIDAALASDGRLYAKGVVTGTARLRRRGRAAAGRRAGLGIEPQESRGAPCGRSCRQAILALCRDRSQPGERDGTRGGPAKRHEA